MSRAAIVGLGGPLLLALVLGCARPSAAPAPPAAPVPATAEELEGLVVRDVPSGLPRLPDDSLTPRAGKKSLEDVAGYAEDPAREREVLGDYGYRFGWERYWGAGSGPLTAVFAHQFHTSDGAAAFTADVAAHDARVYGGLLSENPPRLPAGCRLLRLHDGAPAAGVASPAAFAWCARGVFSVSVTAVAGSVESATDEVRAVANAQLDRLPS